MNIATSSYLIGFSVAVALNVWLCSRGSLSGYGSRLILPSFILALWSGILAWQSAYPVLPSSLLVTMEIVRTSSWLWFFGKLLQPGRIPGRFLWALSLACVYLEVLALLEPLNPRYLQPSLYLGQLFMALSVLILIEQYFRNLRTDLRWRIKFICLAAGTLFAYDFYLYSDALLVHGIDPDAWSARGLVVALISPLIALGVARNSGWSLDTLVSRQAVFHSVTLLGAGFYLVLMATAGYFLKVKGGTLGSVLQAVFLVGAFLLLTLLLFSGQLQVRLRVFLTRHFFTHTYDYRREWLRIIRTLSDTCSELILEERIIQVLGQIVESQNGLLWETTPEQALVLRSRYGNPSLDLPIIDSNDPLIRYMIRREWIVNLKEMRTMPEAYQSLNPPEWLASYPDAWLLIPLLLPENRLRGLVLLTRPSVVVPWNWEVIELLKTSSRLAASYLALEDAGRALTVARQFEAFNRLSTFVVHDLKNLLTQLNLLLGNAKRHQHQTDFSEDAIMTLDHVVDRMNRLMLQIQHPYSQEETPELIELDSLIREVIAQRRMHTPSPVYSSSAPPVWVQASRDRLSAALEHIIQNAQDAAGHYGRVWINRQHDSLKHAVVIIEDDGPGMTETFIRTRLFQPFDTTKGAIGMGIGAYESREYLRALGGDLLVNSIPGAGSTFSLWIPVVGQTDRLDHHPREVQPA